MICRCLAFAKLDRCDGTVDRQCTHGAEPPCNARCAEAPHTPHCTETPCYARSAETACTARCAEACLTTKGFDHRALQLCATAVRRLPSSTHGAEAQHEFSAHEDDWGFKKFLPLSELRSDKEGFLRDGQLHIRVEMEVMLPLGLAPAAGHQPSQTQESGALHSSLRCTHTHQMSRLHVIWPIRPLLALVDASSCREARAT